MFSISDEPVAWEWLSDFVWNVYYELRNEIIAGNVSVIIQLFLYAREKSSAL